MADTPEATPTPEAAPAAKPSFDEMMEKHGGFGDDVPEYLEDTDEPDETEDETETEEAETEDESTDAEAEEAPETEESEEAEESEKEPKKDPKGTAASLAKLKKLAEKHGFKIEGKSITVQERAAFRAQKRKLRAQLEQQTRELQTEAKKIQEDLGGKEAKVTAFLTAVESGDYDSLAKVVGHDSWEELQATILNQQADPNYRKLRELEKKAQEREQQDAERQEQEQKQKQEQKRQQAVQDYRASLVAEMKGHSDRVIKTMADDPHFVGAVIEIQRQHWDPVDQATISVEEALHWQHPKTGQSLVDVLKERKKRLSAALDEDESEDEDEETETESDKDDDEKAKPKSAKSGKKKAPRTSVISSNKKGAASAPKKWKPKDHVALMKHWRTKLDNSD